VLPNAWDVASRLVAEVESGQGKPHPA
jgi:hypothetical protein